MGLLAGFMPHCSTKFRGRNGLSNAPALHPVCTRSRPFETVKDLKGLAVSPERAILTAVYGHGAGRILQGPPFLFLFFGLKRNGVISNAHRANSYANICCPFLESIVLIAKIPSLLIDDSLGLNIRVKAVSGF